VEDSDVDDSTLPLPLLDNYRIDPNASDDIIHEACRMLGGYNRVYVNDFSTSIFTSAYIL
jgi:hypothetical protein